MDPSIVESDLYCARLSLIRPCLVCFAALWPSLLSSLSTFALLAWPHLGPRMALYLSAPVLGGPRMPSKQRHSYPSMSPLSRLGTKLKEPAVNLGSTTAAKNIFRFLFLMFFKKIRPNFCLEKIVSTISFFGPANDRQIDRWIDR